MYYIFPSLVFCEAASISRIDWFSYTESCLSPLKKSMPCQKLRTPRSLYSSPRLRDRTACLSSCWLGGGQRVVIARPRRHNSLKRAQRFNAGGSPSYVFPLFSIKKREISPSKSPNLSLPLPPNPNC